MNIIESITNSNKEKRAASIIKIISDYNIKPLYHHEIINEKSTMNIIAPAKIQENKITFVAHYDIHKKSKTLGYNDNSSGVSILLNLIPHLKDNIELLFTDHEEIGGYGATSYIKKNKPKLIINLDVCGFGEKIFIDTYDYKIKLPKGYVKYENSPFCDAAIFKDYVPTLNIFTGNPGRNLINEIINTTHGKRNDIKNIISQKTLDMVKNYLIKLIKIL